jgi:hypothetical protein
MTLVDNSLNARTLAYVAGVILVFVTGALAFARGRGTLLGVSTAYLAIVAPVLGLVHSGLQSSADRYAYLPGALFCIGAACALFARLRERAPWPVLLTVFAAVWIAGMATLGER